MNNALITFAKPDNEPVKAYRPGSPDMGEVVMPHDHKHVIARYHKVGEKEVRMAIDAAQAAKHDWENTPWDERAAIMARIAEMLATKYRARINAATMLGQSKNCFQAEIDSACETIDFFRYNNHYASKLYAEQPASANDQLNRTEYRPLEGFVFAITPFNFTSIASNLNMTPALMGNTTIWKPSTTALLSNYTDMRIFMEAGLPAGVVNFLPGKGSVISGVALKDKNFNAIHFTPPDRTSTCTRPILVSWVRPAARTSSSSTTAPTRKRWPWPSYAAPSNTKARSAPPLRVPTSPLRCGTT